MTLGGVDTNELSSRTMEARKVPGLYFIGEVMSQIFLSSVMSEKAKKRRWGNGQDTCGFKQ